MKRHFLIPAVLVVLIMSGCDNPKPEAAGDTAAPVQQQDSVVVKGEPCDIKVGNLSFTKAINGADKAVSIDATGKVTFKAGANTDYFSDPDGKLSNNTAPILLAAIDNKKPFTLVAKVTPTFTQTGLYNAGVLYLYGHEAQYQKFCFEQDEFGDKRIVTVRTKGTSDDNNHEMPGQPFVYMKISSDTRTVASYYSRDNKTWKMVRLYKNDYPESLWVGISTQCPQDTGTVSYFEQLSLELKSVADFRRGI